MSSLDEAPAAPSSPAAVKSFRTLDEVVIEGGRARLGWADFREFISFREVLYAVAWRRIKIRYKQAAFGIGWAVAQPLLASLVFAIFVGRVSQVGSEGVRYYEFAITGMVAYTFFSNIATTGLTSLVVDAFLLRKVYFPRAIMPVSSVLSAGFDLIPALAVVLVVDAVSVRSPGVEWLALPIPLLLVAIFGLGLSLFTSSINLYYRDLGYVFPFALQISLFVSPVIYSLQAVPSSWQPAYSALNPIAPAIDGLRRVLLHGEWPAWGQTGWAFLFSTSVLVAGYAWFKWLEPGFADRV